MRRGGLLGGPPGGPSAARLPTDEPAPASYIPDALGAAEAHRVAGVTDCHVHINPFWEMRPDARELVGHHDPRVETYVRDARAFLDYLTESGVERAVLVNYVSPEVVGYTEAANRFASDYARTDPARLLATGGIRPDHPDPEREVGRLVHELGLRALKLHPPHQWFRPDGYVDGSFPSLRRIYAACERERLPVIFHTGTSVFPRARNRFSDPMFVEEVALDFPELPIVLAHGGRPLWTEAAVFLARRFANVWLEVSSVPPSRLLEYFPQLPKLTAKTLFGTDWPGPGVREIRKNLDEFRALDLSSEAKERILVENPRRVFPPQA